jgi:ABC-type sugar transport system permease subunit
MATTVRTAIVVAACVLGGFAAFGCGIAALLELDGFGAPRSGPRPLYVASLFAGLAASVIVPIVLWRALLPENAPPVIAGVALFAGAFVLVLLVSGVT